jgi:hypothetical protein
VEALLKKVLPNAQVKMDAGHVLFSRLGKMLDQLHALYGEYQQEQPQICTLQLPCAAVGF